MVVDSSMVEVVADKVHFDTQVVVVDSCIEVVDFLASHLDTQVVVDKVQVVNYCMVGCT